MEAGYISFGKSSANTGIDGTPATVSNDFDGIDLLVKGILPVNNKLNLFAKIGAAKMNDDSNVSDASLNTSFTATGSTWTPLIGAGISYDINQHFSLNLQDIYSVKTTYQYQGADVNMPALNAFLAGISIKANV